MGEVPERVILVTADVVGLCPSIPHTEGLEVLSKQYDKFLQKKAPTEDIIKMVDFALKNYFFKFNSKFFQQISGTAIGTKFSYPLETTVGSSRCGSKRCQVCLNVSETAIFEYFQTKRQYKINHHHDCNDKCLIYLLSCKICGLQYVGSATSRFRLRWNKDFD